MEPSPSPESPSPESPSPGSPSPGSPSPGSPSPDSSSPESLSPESLDTLFELADLGIRAGLEGQGPPSVDVAALSPPLREPVGVFVTLEVSGQLNGCIGTVEPVEPLGAAVPRLAWSAAFADTRLPELSEADYSALVVKLSLMSPLTPLPSASEEELVGSLRPGVDGLVIRRGTAGATFLPAVWEKVPDPLAFVRHLEAKAGFRPGDWRPGTRAWRYTAAEHRRPTAEIRRGRSAA